MEILYLIITLLIGGLIGYFIASRQLNSLKTQLYLQTKHHEDLLEAEKKQHATETERYREENLRIQNQAENNIKTGRRSKPAGSCPAGGKACTRRKTRPSKTRNRKSA